MAKTNKQLQAEIDKLTIEKNNLVDMLEIAEKGIRGVSKILGLDGIAETTYFNDADIGTIEIALKQILQKNKDLFKDILKYEKELEEQDKEIEELKENIADLNESNKYRLDCMCDYESKIEELNKELDSWRTHHKDNVKVKTPHKDVLDALSKELQTQIILKNTYKKENKRLKKRRREGRYNIDKFITNLTKGAYVYVEGASRPTKLHKRLTDAIAEKQRLEKKTGKKVYILTNL